MRNRILTGWTLSRLLYVLLGVLITIQAILDKQWAGILFGAYFFIMGIFGLGCAGGNCYVKPNSTVNKPLTDEDEPFFEEIK